MVPLSWLHHILTRCQLNNSAHHKVDKLDNNSIFLILANLPHISSVHPIIARPSYSKVEYLLAKLSPSSSTCLILDKLAIHSYMHPSMVKVLPHSIMHITMAKQFHNSLLSILARLCLTSQVYISQDQLFSLI
jgi:hypothetical protein